jgi:pSer/pThr/pTyr-binding forkhead associated (FHA) protein
MDILGKARRIESKIAGRLDEAAKEFVRSGAREPLEIVHAILDEVEQEIQSGGRGTRVFPFNQIEVAVLAPSPEARAWLEAVFESDPPLRARIMERLRSAGCHPSEIVVSINYVARAQKNWRTPEFRLNFARVTQPAVEDPDADSTRDRIEVTVLRGVTEQRTYSFLSGRIDFGRCAEVRDSRNRLLRTNHVAFTEGSGDVNQSVSRQHAHIVYEPDSGSFRLHDDGSGHGTGIVREGRTVPVPRGFRGVRLQSGDEVVLGEARVRIRFHADKNRQV